MVKARCENCDKEYDFDGTEMIPLCEVKHLFERISPGETVPAGECPDCGALCHLIIEKAKVKRLDSISTHKAELEIGECECGYHFAIDATFLERVKDFNFKCPSCKGLIETKEAFPI